MADSLRYQKNLALALAPDQAYEGPDPNERQRAAAHPDRSVWVNASAGSGKTKVLTDRVLRLLLPRSADEDGTPAHRLLCLTFTKAGANEMALRLNERLSRWAVMKESDLVADMNDKLLGRAPHDYEIKAARNLFARIVDVPGGLKIMTIHAFCQSLLGRFPLEAGLPPHFTALDEAQAQKLILSARDNVLRAARRKPDSELGKALGAVAAIQNDGGFFTLLRDVISERHQLRRLLADYGDVAGIYSEICRFYDIPSGMSAEDFLRDACESNAFDERGLREACRVLTETGTEKKDGGKALGIQRWLDADAGARQKGFHDYKRNFLKADGELLKDQCTKAVRDARPDIAALLQEEAERLYKLDDRLNAVASACFSRDLLFICAEILRTYEILKNERAALDFDDLILHTLSLLKGRDMAGWVMYKLDEGLDHILIDEAQDTNPEQWEIIKALCDEFFSGAGARSGMARTIFSVGDEKQSIYSFQRAAPEKFQAMQDYFAAKVKAAQQAFEPVALNVSFRSVRAVLSFVDRVFADDNMRKGLGSEPIVHTSFHYKRPGLVELWPLFTTPEKQQRDFWAPPAEPLGSRSSAAMLAEHIGDTIKGWIDNGEILEAKGRAIMPGDIMILVRSRTAFVNQMIRALKIRQIPVSGIDRMVLKDQLAVQDLLACAQFALLPDDDLSLACMLKSPLIGWSDEQLEKYAAYRPVGQSLWDALQDHAQDEFGGMPDLVAYLSRLIDRAGRDHPYEFFGRLLQETCPASSSGGLHAITARLGEEVLDPLDEFLNAAINYEASDLPTIQGFIVAIQRGEAEIKREQEEGSKTVRIMTVHGAKGLQAPIVIMPDTVRTTSTPPGSSNHRLIWPNKSDLAIPLWSPRKNTDCQRYTDILGIVNARQNEEYKRLFYVAMTRAEDRLYIAGYAGKRAPIEESWYNYARRAMESLPYETRSFSAKAFEEAGEPPVLLCYGDEEPHQSGLEPEKPASRSDGGLLDENPWVLQAPPVESSALQPFMPSRQQEEEPPVYSPLSGADNYRFRRGLVTHKLLQYLPDLPAETRENAALQFVSRHAADLPGDIQQDIVYETIEVLRHKDWAPLFGPGSQAEVPLTGQAGNRMVSGQVDRLFVSDSEVWIVDYKSNRPAPRDQNAIPEVYRQQMKAYSDIVSNIYNNRKVFCFLLWTDGPHLMPVTIVDEDKTPA